MRRLGWLGWGACGVVVLATCLAHGGSLQGGFVYDDHRFIEHNAAIRTVQVADFVSDPATASHGDGIRHDIYRPLRTLLFSIEYALFAERAAQGAVEFHLPLWHGVSLLLHALNALLVLRLLRPLLRGALLPATAGALLFAVHPVTSESVAWLSSQGDLLAVTFLLAGLIVLERRGWPRTLAGLGLFALACLAKESALIFPFLLVLRDLALPRSIGDEARPGLTAPAMGTTWGRAALLAGVAGLYFVLRLSVIEDLAQVAHPGGSPWASARAMLHGLAWYGGTLLWPAGFTFDVRIEVPLRWSDPEVAVGLGLLLSLIAAGVWGLRRRRWLLAFATLGFLFALGPVSNVIVPLKAFVADRFLYPALVCVAAGLAAALARTRGSLQAALATVLVGVLGVFGALAAARDAAWASDFHLWDAVRRDRPANPNAYQGVAYEYARQKKVGLAERAYTSYLEANPLDGKSLRSMGDLFGEVAESLVTGDPAFEQGTSLPLRRKQARVAQITLYRRALQIWEAPGGLVQGRGSERMRAEMLQHWMEAGVDLGDLHTAKFANDTLIDREAGESLHADPKAVMARASWPRRRARVLFALRGVLAVMERSIPAERRERVLADRTAVIEDIGLDPARSGRALLPALEMQIASLIEEALARDDLTPDPGLFLHQSALLGMLGAHERAREVLRRGLVVHPGQPYLERELRAVDAMLRGDGGR